MEQNLNANPIKPTRCCKKKWWIILVIVVVVLAIGGGVAYYCWQRGGAALVQTKNEFLEVTLPTPYQKITTPAQVAGKSNFFEANTRIRIKDNNGNVLADTFTTAAGWMDNLYPFSAAVSYGAPSTPKGTVEVFEDSAQDGSEVNKVVIPVVFSDQTSEASADADDLSWRTTDLMGAYTFQYPLGWHVAEIWPDILDLGMTVWISPEPLSTRPRGGPFNTITINDKSNLPNPEEVLQQEIAEYKNFLTDLEEEIFEANVGTVYHYKGKVDFYAIDGKVPSETYFFIVEGYSPDNPNKHVISVTEDFSFVGDTSKADILRKIVMSFNKVVLK